MISAIVPARNEEANIARVVESLDGQAEVREIIVVNDQSSDRTAEILAELAARLAKLRVIEISALPAGWVDGSRDARAGGPGQRRTTPNPKMMVQAAATTSATPVATVRRSNLRRRLKDRAR